MEEKAVLENGGDNYVHFLLVINLLRIGREQYTWTRNSSLISSTNAQSDRRREREREREKRSRTQAFKEIYEVLFRCQIIPRRVPVMGMRVCIRERRMNIERNKYRVYI